MGLSSNVLWHQTKKDGLMGILKTRKLYYSYCLEDVLFSELGVGGIAFPMVSLCDIPLSEYGENKWAYGNYAIGFSRKWGIKKGFNPVCYCHPNSSYLQTMHENLIDASFSGKEPQIDSAIFPFAYIKYVESPLPHRKFKNYRFYDEKEIRLVPRKRELGEFKFCLSNYQYQKYKEEHGNSLLGKMGVDFLYDDIKYIIVETENNRKEVLSFFRKKAFDSSQIVILTKAQILEDIVGNNHNEKMPSFLCGEDRNKLFKEARKVGQEIFGDK